MKTWCAFSFWRMNMRNIIIALITMLYVNNVPAFDLFNPDRGKPPPPEVKIIPPTFITTGSQKLPTPFIAKAIVVQKKKPEKMLPQRDFSLKGTSLIGDKRIAILVAPDKKEFIQYLKNNDRTEISSEKFKDYYLLNVEAREVKIEYPTNAPCKKDNETEGIKCADVGDGLTIATLSLKQRKALKAPRPPVAPRPPPSATEKSEQKDLAKRKEIYKNFKRKVIKDEDVPPGMRVVRTPFGDRLVPIK